MKKLGDSNCWAFALIGSAVLAWSVGCGGDALTGPTATVSGTLKQDGKPVGAGYSIVFEQDGGDNFMATGSTGADGKYVLKTSVADELPTGSYKVSVSPPGSSDDNIASDDTKDYSAAMQGGGETEPETPPDEPSSIPKKYLSTDSSGLKFTVKEGPNTIDINLTE